MRRLIRSAVVFYFLVEVAAFIAAVYRTLQEPHSMYAFYFWFYLGRLTFLVAATVFYFNRTEKRFYVPTLSELSNENYWSLVFICLAGSKLLFAHFFVQLPLYPLLEYSTLTFMITQLLISYQSQYWILDRKRTREKRIFKLVRKAQLSKEEYETVLPMLVENGRKNQRSPWLWRAIVFLAVVVLGAIFNAIAVQLVDAYGSLLKH